MRKTVSRLIAAGLSAATLTLGLTASAVTTASSALASPTCHGTSPSCVGHDPVVYGCVSSFTKELSNSYGTVWEQFSNNCDAKWAQGQLNSQSVRNHYTMQVAITTTDGTEYLCVPSTSSDTGQPFEYCTGTDGASTRAYTDMADGHKQASALVYFYSATGHQLGPPLQVTF